MFDTSRNSVEIAAGGIKLDRSNTRLLVRKIVFAGTARVTGKIYDTNSDYFKFEATNDGSYINTEAKPDVPGTLTLRSRDGLLKSYLMTCYLCGFE